MNIDFVTYPPIALAEHPPRNPRDMLLAAYRARRAEAIGAKWAAIATGGGGFEWTLHSLVADAWRMMQDSL